MRQLVYTMFIISSRFVSLVVKRIINKVSKILKILYPSLSTKSSFAFYDFINSFIC